MISNHNSSRVLFDKIVSVYIGDLATIWGPAKLKGLARAILCLADVLVEHRLLIDTDTNKHRQTDRHGYRAMA